MNKPDWKDAPEWANYLAMDANGDWQWFEFKPYPLCQHKEWRENSGRIILAARIDHKWAGSLEPRPE